MHKKSVRHAGIRRQRYAIYPTYGGGIGKRAGCGISIGTNGVSVFEHARNNAPYVLAHNVPIKGWTHVAVVYTNRKPTLYVNGAVVKTGNRSRWEVFPGTSFRDASNSRYGPYLGRIDEPMLFDRGLSAKEIQVVLDAAHPLRKLM